MLRRFFSTTLGQIVAIIACSSIGTFALFVAIILNVSAPPGPPWPWPEAYRIIATANLMKNVRAADRAAALAAAQSKDLSLRVVDFPQPCENVTLDTRELENVLREHIENAATLMVLGCDRESPVSRFQVLMPFDGQVLEFSGERSSRMPLRFTFPFLTALAFLCIGVVAMSAWAVWRVIRPLRRLSEKADAFAHDVAVVEPLALQGPLEVRRAAQAFNRMQERIAGFVQSRTRMLAAISHDLRTPLTRMRLQVETGKEETMRPRLLRDITLMQTMVDSALSFLSSGLDKETQEWLDVGALLSTLCDEYEEGGARIRYDGQDAIRLYCRPNAMQRACANLIENALAYGEHVVVDAGNDNGEISITVCDDGPGIPAQHLQKVTEPFVRLDSARAQRPGSVGLGLSIVAEIMNAHGGTLSLEKGRPAGLCARIRLPADGPAAG
ncbi:MULTISPECIES: ATP-binding protein [unclassified Achromobacter]|uniref:ATP-binding protein n=1 Tax=unclassified Achromobacter TaxID=2626865 RepID=UPI000B51BAA4|nr:MULTISPECIES: ATP-binding protein [unclassified Achromobacter]OWT76929.1 two-component sensor histidine kinase [Achromobacter sp. HZ28]OWT77809.1 two-component sensor histidine kinase [Achromobacter sp. HZ34]